MRPKEEQEIKERTIRQRDLAKVVIALIAVSTRGEKYRKTPSTHSSMKVKERVCLPSPHISKYSVAVRAFLQKAAGAFSRPPEDTINIT